MDTDFWLKKWESQVLGFHLTEPNPLLTNHIGLLKLPGGARIFLPLCGKTRDIGWLLEQGYRVVGCELSELAVAALFQELDVSPEITKFVDGLRYSAPNVEVFVYDIFKLSADVLGDIDAIYDRAALIALPDTMRSRYAATLMSLTDSAPQLLVTVLYDQSQLEGPPFSVSDGSVQEYYAKSYELELLTSLDIPGGLKGQCPAVENVWLLSSHQVE